MPATFATVRRLALRLPEVEEGSAYGTAALKVRGKMFVRLKEDGETLVLRCGPFDREHLLASAPAVFFLTEHYREYPYVLLRLRAASAAQLKEVIAESWRQVAPKALVVAYDSAQRR